MCKLCTPGSKQVARQGTRRPDAFSLPLPASPCLPCRQDPSGLLYYQFEFTIESLKWKRHNVAVLATQVSI